MMFVYRARLSVSGHARGLDLVRVGLFLLIMVFLLAIGVVVLGLGLLGLRVRESLRLALADTLGSRLLYLLGGSLWGGALEKSV
jgi:hypothetical protein